VENGEATGITVEIDGQPVEYIGDIDVFGWHKNVRSSSYILPTLLMAIEHYFYEKIEAGESIESDVRLLLAMSRSLAIVGLLFVVAKSYRLLFLKHLMPFLADYRIFIWDRHTTAHAFKISPNGLPGVWREQVEEWNNRAHANEILGCIVLHLIHHNPVFRQAFESVRSSWRPLLDEMQATGDVDIEFLQIFHYLNPENSKVVKEDGRTFLEYNEPAEVADFLGHMRQYHNESVQETFVIPHAYRNIIAEDRHLSLVQLDEVWNQVTSMYEKIDKQSVDHCSGEQAWASAYSTVMAGVKVLVHHRNVWSVRRPEYDAWILSLIGDLIEKQFCWNGSFDRLSINDNWNIVLAEIIPVYWKDSLTDKALRKAVAGVLLLFNEPTVKSFFVSCSKYLSWSDPALIQAQNLLIIYSGWVFRCSGLYKSADDELRKAEKMLSDQFVDGVLSQELLDWSTVRQQEQFEENEFVAWQRSLTGRERKTDLYKEVLTPLFDALPVLRDVESDVDKAYLTALYLQASTQLLRQFEHGNNRERDDVALNSPFEEKVIPKLARSLLDVTPGDKQRQLWEPLLGLGYKAQKWIKSFCNTFFTNLDHTDTYDQMIKVLEEMVVFTQAAETWKTAHIKRFEDFRLCLLGLNPAFMRFWKHDYSLFTEKAKHIYLQWFLKRPYNPLCLSALLDFMITKSGAFALKEGLFITAYYCSFSMQYRLLPTPENSTWVGNPELDNKLAATFTYLSKTQLTEIKADESSFKSFKEVVQYLMSVQHAVGFELQTALLGE
jgi:hypothetical protein